ncbi:MAG: DNA methyltransferase [Candidatus Firestonebacteria bacterium]
MPDNKENDLQTGLYWKNKKTEVERIKLPFQTIETINESRATREQEKKIGSSMFKSEQDKSWYNRLIWGDNKYVMASLLDDFAGKIDLVYIDPPFYSGADQTIKIPIGGDEKLLKEPSALEDYAYRNTWNKNQEGFFQWIYERLLIIRDLLSPNGSLYIRYDWHFGHYVKIIADEIFGKDNFRNEIVLNRIKKSDTNVRKINAATDSLFFYSFGDYIINHLKIKIKKEEGYWHAMDSQGQGEVRVFFGKKMEPPSGRHWTFNQEKINEMIKEKRIRLNPKTGTPAYWIDEKDEQLIDSNWTDIPGYSFSTPYPTENAEEVLERVIKISSNPGQLVADFFCGSGTTAAVAEKLSRRWITCDIGRFSIHTTRKRMLEIENCKPFIVQNLGKYERQYWQGITFKKKTEEQTPLYEYLQFIIKLYNADPLTGMMHIHGKKGKRLVHVGAIDVPVTLSEIQDAINETKKAKQDSLDILGWEWEMGLHDVVEKAAKSNGINLRLFSIPRDVMDSRAVEKGEITFYELAYLEVKAEKNKEGSIYIELKDFAIPNMDLVPQEVREKIKKWSDYIDYWSVDWDWNEDTFHNMWQSYRTKRERKLDIKSDTHKYDKRGKHLIMIKVIDIFGNDTTRVLEVSA